MKKKILLFEPDGLFRNTLLEQISLNKDFDVTEVNGFDDVQEGSDGVSMDIPAEHYNLTVEELDLSSRTLNCLKRAGLNKVGEVIEKSKEELLSIRNFGEKSYNELYDKFREMDILPDSSSKFIGGSEEVLEE